MYYDLLTDRDKKAIDALIDAYGGAKAINDKIVAMQDYQARKKIATDKGFGDTLDKAEKYVASFPKVEDFIEKEKIEVTKPGLCTTQVSGFQGAPVTLECMRLLAENGQTLIPSEFISVVPMTDEYVYGGDLLTTLAMTENIMGVSKFCSTNLIGLPLAEERFTRLEKITGEKFDRRDLGEGMSQLILKNMGTPFGNLGGVEVADCNHLVYLDGLLRYSLETGANFFLNPSWSTIVAACYFGRQIDTISFKISMLLSIQNVVQFKMLMNIVKAYLRDDGTTPIYEVNIGNGASPETFVRCSEELEASDLPYISLAAHMRINPDLGMPDFDWTKNAHKVFDTGTNLTIKYESDGTSRPYDTMGDYFLSDEERNEKVELIGNVIYHKCLRCDLDVKEIMKRGHAARFAKISSR